MDLKSAFYQAENRAIAAVQIRQGDYIKDGLLYCGKCNTPKQCEVELFGTVRKPYCLCKCEAEKINAENERRRKEARQFAIAEKRAAGFPDRDLIDCTFAADDGGDERVTRIALNYVEHFGRMLKSGKGLLFFGGVGTGKTFIAACIANALIDRGYDCLVTNFSRLVNTVQGMRSGRQEYMDGLNAFDLMVIDDLAAERDTDFVAEIVYNIIDGRKRAGLPIIVTTNLTAEELKSPADTKRARIYSRLMEMCIPVEVNGADRRKEVLKRDFAELKELLDL